MTPLCPYLRTLDAPNAPWNAYDATPIDVEAYTERQWLDVEPAPLPLAARYYLRRDMERTRAAVADNTVYHCTVEPGTDGDVPVYMIALYDTETKAKLGYFADDFIA